MEGIKVFHEHDICHRDLKLENILLDKVFVLKYVTLVLLV
jgi:serine/threonine protein kinase